MIIGFSGRAGAGKDTAAEALIEEYPDYFERLSFATPMKVALCDLFGWDISEWESLDWKESPNDKSYGHTPRRVAQTFGTDWGRDMISQNIWVDHAMHMAEKIEAYNGNHVIFTDVRFPNEAEAIQSRGGKVIHLSREGSLRTDAKHESEQDLSQLADMCIEAADGDIAGLKEMVLNIMPIWLPLETYK